VPPDQPGLTLDAAPEPEEGDVPERVVRPAAVVTRDDIEREAPRRSGKPPKLVARRVRRVVRHVDPWSVLKVSLVFYVCGYIVTMVAGILLWNIAERADMISKVEDFVEELGAYERFELLPDVILQRALLIGAILTVVATGLTVLGAVLFNLISDLVGGVRVVFVEEDTARPMPTRPSPLRTGVPHPDRSDGLEHTSQISR
jgi:hypothetical protein